MQGLLALIDRMLAAGSPAAAPKPAAPPGRGPAPSVDDPRIYDGMAYGTPMEPFVTGALAYRPDPAKGSMAPLRPGPGTPQTADVYRHVMEMALRSPTMSLGVADPSRIGVLDTLGPRPVEPEARRHPWYASIDGLYRPNVDRGWATVDWSYDRPGYSLGHEFMHRGLFDVLDKFRSEPATKGSADPHYQHRLMSEAGRTGEVPTAVLGSLMRPVPGDDDRMRAINALAVQRLLASRPRMGPR